ncbi:MAG: ABC transporter substrate-binding protein [Desulfoprunum sp.]|nr:ABC transporter substrate-binding protein [Desulfoprunum sp.]
MPRHNLSPFILLLALCTSLSFFPSRALSETTPQLEPVNLQLRWLHQFQFAGYYAALAKGYYREAGLDVTLLEGGPDKNTINAVLGGQAQYGVTNAEILLHKINGKPLVVLAAIFQHSPLVFVAREEKGINHPQDLIGKRVKMSRSSRDIELQTTLMNEGISLDLLKLLEGGASYHYYFTPEIDAVSAYITNQPYYYKANNVGFSLIRPSAYGVDFYGDCLFTSERERKNHPERVEAFRRASLRGWEYAMSHTEEIIEIILTTYHSEKSRDHLRYEAQEMQKLILPELVEIGQMNPGRWNHIADTFVRNKMARADYSLKGFIYTPGHDLDLTGLMQLIGLLAIIIAVVTVVAVTLFVFNKRLQQEIEKHETTEAALHESESKLISYSNQMEQFSLSAASMLSMKDEQLIFAKISQAIVDYSDFRRVLISLFKDEAPYRDLIGYGGVSEEIVEKVRKTALPKSWYDKVFSHGIPLGRFSYYIPHTMKNILNQEATIYGDGPAPADNEGWHPEDNLFVRMNDEHENFIGVISVDDSKSGFKPTSEIVRPLEIFASLIAQIIIHKREQSRREQLEEQLRQAQKMEAIGTLTGGIAHDFNNILGVIIGNAELALLDIPEWNSATHNLQEIKKASGRARDIVQHLLTFSRKTARELKPVVIREIIEDSLKFLRSTLPATITISKEIQLNDERVLADSTQIYQILLNLCTNAAHAMEKATDGALTVRAEMTHLTDSLTAATSEIPGGDYVTITVSDTGHGIDPQTLHQIFDPYFTTKEIGKGTGMGLTIVQGLVKSHNGAITVASTPGSGTSFTVYLPLAPEGDRPESPADQTIPSGAERLLLVDDEEALLRINRLALERLGYTVLTDSSPIKALERIMADPQAIDLVISDMTMPQMTGDILAEKIHALRPDLPIFLCTGYSDRTEKLADSPIIRGYFHKPLAITTLALAIRRELDQISAGQGG